MTTGAQRAAAVLASRIANAAPIEPVESGGRAARRRASLGLHRALTLALAKLGPVELVEVAAWLGRPANVAWMAEHVVDVALLNVDEDRHGMGGPK